MDDRADLYTTTIPPMLKAMEDTETTAEYAREYLMPNFFFHYTTAYSILRKSGLGIGKSDFIGGLPLKD